MKQLYTLLILLIPFVGFGQCVKGDCEDGKGTYNWADGRKYKGKFKNGNAYGKGTLTWADGRKYKGEFKDGVRSGIGIFNFANGHKYEGEWKNDKKNGIGSFFYLNGQKYVGEWKNGKRNGQGTLTYNTGQILYEGEWMNGLWSGQGTYYSNQGKYVGEWKDGKRNGQGTYIWNNGDRYVGEWKGGKRNGQGTFYYFFIGDKYVGEWKGGKEDGKGTYIWNNGDRYEGIFKDGFRIDRPSNFSNEKIVEKFLDSKINLDNYEGIYRYQNINNTDNAQYKFLILKDEFKYNGYLISAKCNKCEYWKAGSLIFEMTEGAYKGLLDVQWNFAINNKKQSILYSEFDGGILSDKEGLSILKLYPKLEKNNIVNNRESESNYTVDVLSNSRIIQENNNKQKGSSEVNIDIPKNNKLKNRYAIVIGNENYSSFQKTLEKEQDVPFAVNDANTFKKYALETLGVEEENLFFLENATSGQMNQTIDLVTKIVSKLGNKAELIFYYAGHGFPDELTKEPYLIPVDVSSSYLNNAISLDELYEKFSKTGAKKVLAFVDACFSGGARENSLLASRGVKINPKMTDISNNLVVFSASSETQSALPYNEENHGMFTFYLLKKIKESKGRITLGELFDYVSEEVSLNSLKINQKEQDPNVIFSPKIENKWRSWEIY